MGTVELTEDIVYHEWWTSPCWGDHPVQMGPQEPGDSNKVCGEDIGASGDTGIELIEMIISLYVYIPVLYISHSVKAVKVS